MTDIATLAIALDDFPAPTLLVEADGNRVSWSNNAAQEHFGTSARRIAATPLGDLLPEIAGLPAQVARVCAEGATLVLRDMQLNGGLYDLVAYPSGDRAGVAFTPHRSTNGRDQKGRPIQALGQMIGHELKNPLAGIKGAAQLLRDDVATPEAHGLIDLIVSEIDRLKRLAERLATFGDTDIADPKRVNIHTLLRNTRKLIAQSSATDGGTILFTEDYDPSLPHVEGDADQLMQVLINLIKNAVEAMEREGEITLKTRSRPGTRREGRLLPIEVQVIDTGPGLPTHLRDRVWEPFVTSKPNGQGLGLSLVAKTVAAHGGIVELDSRPGRTRFSLLLPAAPELQETSHGI